MHESDKLTDRNIKRGKIADNNIRLTRYVEILMETVESARNELMGNMIPMIKLRVNYV